MLHQPAPITVITSTTWHDWQPRSRYMVAIGWRRRLLMLLVPYLATDVVEHDAPPQAPPGIYPRPGEELGSALTRSNKEVR